MQVNDLVQVITSVREVHVKFMCEDTKVAINKEDTKVAINKEDTKVAINKEDTTAKECKYIDGP